MSHQDTSIIKKPKYFSMIHHKRKRLQVFFAVAAFLIAGIASISFTNSDKNQVLMKVIMDRLDSGHYQPQAVNDDFSKRVFEIYLKRLDYNKRFLTSKDVFALKKYEDKIDDLIQEGNYELQQIAMQMLQKRIAQFETYYQDLLAKPFNFEKDEYLETDNEKLEFVRSEEELQERWRKLLKYQTLSRLQDLVEEQEEALEKGELKAEKSFAELEAEAREKVLKNNVNWSKRMEKVNETDRISTYMNAIAGAYDPHSGYFPPIDKENFDIAMSGRLEGIGATLQEKDGYIKVVRIVPGSASWRQGELKAEDVILKVGQADEEAVDIVDMRLDDAVQLIRGPKGTEVRLTVKKPDGETTVIPIIRDIVIIEEGYAKTAVLRDESTNLDVGYIKLPKFYADFNRDNGRSCAVDVESAITDLQKENVNGLILDLRNNGGGSLQDVVDMAGLFIESGPVVQVKSKNGNPYVYGDNNETVQYDGPLIILVNSFSASASEILAAAIQDYDRGLIIGSETTFGKGTVQRFMDLDRSVSEAYNDIKPLGSIKLTTQKFYRINGGTNQLKGVEPHIVLPDAYRYIETGEQEREFPLTWDEIDQAPYQKWDNAPDYRKIVSNSQKRVEANATFALIEENAQRMKRQRDQSKYTLCYDKYVVEQEKRKAEGDKYDDIEKEIESLNIRSLAKDLPALEADTAKMASIKDLHEGVKKDVYINEAMKVMADMQ